MKKLFFLSFLRRLLSKLGFYRPDGVYFLGKTDVLPPPLSAEEENLLLERWTGCEEDVKRKLIEHNLRLVIFIAKKFDNTGLDTEDLVSIGTIGLIKAVNTYRADKNTKLATYASRCIENEILMHLRKSVNLKAEISIDEPLNTDCDGNELLLSDVLGTEPDCVYKPLEDEALRLLLSGILTKLPEREKTIITMRFGLFGRRELTQKEIAEKLGISQSYISRLEKKIISKLRRELSRII